MKCSEGKRNNFLKEPSEFVDQLLKALGIPKNAKKAIITIEAGKFVEIELQLTAIENGEILETKKYHLVEIEESRS